MEFEKYYMIHWKEYFWFLFDRALRVILYFFIICSVLFVTIIFTLFITGNLSNDGFLFCTALSIFIFLDMCLAYIPSVYFVNRSNFGYDKRFAATQHLGITREGITSSYELGDILLQWEYFKKVKETRHNIYFYITKKQYTFIPKSILNQTEISTLRNCIIQFFNNKKSV
ncbi:MAG: YcxB family protein [Bacillota bacterium]|nr:YcxB family protein [Bacillota bacterium]